MLFMNVSDWFNNSIQNQVKVSKPSVFFLLFFTKNFIFLRSFRIVFFHLRYFPHRFVFFIGFSTLIFQLVYFPSKCFLSQCCLIGTALSLRIHPIKCFHPYVLCSPGFFDSSLLLCKIDLYFLILFIQPNKYSP